MKAEDPYLVAKRKARYGHKDWLVWVDRTGQKQTAQLTPESIKRCLLDKGTQGKWSLIAASTAVTFRDGWRVGINILNQFKYGYR